MDFGYNKDSKSGSLFGNNQKFIGSKLKAFKKTIENMSK